MKVTNKQYAQSLFEATRDLGKSELNTRLENFVKLLAKNNHLSRLEAICLEFDKVWQAQAGVVEAAVVSANKLEAETLEALRLYITKKTGISQIELKHHVDHKILAGFVLRFGDQVLDGSASKLIGNLSKEFIK